MIAERKLDYKTQLGVKSAAITIKKGYGHLLHKLILLVVGFGEVFNVILQPLNLALHGGQTAL